MADPTQDKIIAIIQDILQEDAGGAAVEVTPDASMETLPAWDSMSFMKVFMAINEAFGVDPDFDDAVHYTSVPALTAYIKSVRA